MNLRKILFPIILLLLIVFADLGSKAYFKNQFYNIDQDFIYATSFLEIRNLCNHGVSFGMLSNLNPQTIKIFIICIFVLLIIYSYFAIKSNKMNVYWNFMIIGGAIANLIDRFQNGCVYDFLDFHIASYHWYVFNIADSFITIGALLIIFNVQAKK